jgi:hypothetical protein
MTLALEDLPATVLPPAVLEAASAAKWVLDDIGEADLSGLTGEQLRAAISAWHQVAARVDSLELRLLAAADAAGMARAAGAASTGAWAARLVNEDSADAHRRAKLAGRLERTHRVTGMALSEGKLSQRHAEVIVEATVNLPTGLSPDQRAAVEESLVAKAEAMSPQALRRVARRALEAVESDTAKVDEHEDTQVRDEETAALMRARLTLHDNGDGTVSGHFTVPELQGQLLRKILDSMTAPRRGKLGASHAQAGEQGIRADWDHARGLAFCELLEHLPTDRLHGKVAATLVVMVDAEVMHGAMKAAGLDTGGSLSSGEVRRLACGAGILPAVLGKKSRVLDLGRSTRLFTEAQRIAVGIKHQTCAAHGCERPFAWCELHHRRPWRLGGRTDLDQAMPLCWFHHRRIHDDAFVHWESSEGVITFHRTC